MTTPQQIHVLIVGAGPAGLCAALQLLQLGYRVAIVDRLILPRPNIGESLTPGLASILDTLNARHVLDLVAHRRCTTTRRIWREREADLQVRDSTSHIMVDRAEFDLALLDLARQRGATCWVPANVLSIDGSPGDWNIQIDTGDTIEALRAVYWLDARGRRANRDTLALAPPLLAIWTEISSQHAIEETCIEATPHGWLWGAPLADGRYRVMAFCDPVEARHRETVDPLLRGNACTRFRTSLSQSTLFASFANTPFTSALQACSATPGVNPDCWQCGTFKIGDAAFTLDPLSSSGVEKAMRFSLKAATALHTTLLSSSNESLAREFFETNLYNTVARHSQWTEGFYARAWPAPTHPFWRRRSEAWQPALVRPSWAGPLAKTSAARMRPRIVPPLQSLDSESLRHLLHAPMRLSPELAFVDLPCDVGQRVERRTAVQHPNLAEPVAYVEQLELVALLASITSATDLRQWINLSSAQIPPQKAVKVAQWLLQRGLIFAAESGERKIG